MIRRDSRWSRMPPFYNNPAKAIVPDYALGPHTASLGLAYSNSTTLLARFTHGMFVGQHGSWNRKPRSGYKVIFVPFRDGKPTGNPIDVLTGFVKENDDWGQFLSGLQPSATWNVGCSPTLIRA